MQRETDDGYKRTNREMVQEPKGAGICFGCDSIMVREGSKCRVCGSRHGLKKQVRK
jgi:rRNA maturation endonuclease Nob1